MTCGEEPNMEMRYDREYYDGSYEDEFTLYDGFGGRPESFDWRSKNVVTDIKDQQRCGSCWAFGAVGVVESMNAIAKNPLVSLSEQQLIDCDMNDNGCDGGYRPYALQYIRHNGIVPEELYPYAGKELDSCKLNTTLQRVYVKTVKYIRRNESAMADFVFYKGPLSVGINVTKDLFHYQSGVFTPSKEDCEQNPQGTHALAVVGYGSQNGEDYWIIKNSWGKRWGMDGFFLYKRGANSCGIADSPCSVEA
ncbi:unnamed protein product [Anisakis simplex]|uniref:Cathepsin F (inferred by orthology to a S. mansoni protein) n=1 Tax=Anisakis simplex TaxID=6269 RepID=A0A0M3KAV0_ANISI|nr:unnamed protein product [Anisakis simplex]